MVLALPVAAQTNDATPFYAGTSLGVTHVSNIYRVSSGANSDQILSAGLLAGLDKRLGRQHLTVDGSLQDNRYSKTLGLNNKSYSLRSALEWQTIGNLSGTVTASSSRSLADFNAGGGVDPFYTKNTERSDEYSAIARLGVLSRYTIEGGLNYRKLDYSASQYDRFAHHQDAGWVGFFGTPGGNLKLGLSARHTRGQFPRYPNGRYTFDPITFQLIALTSPSDYSRDDIDLTAHWNFSGKTGIDARLSRSRTDNGTTISTMRDFSGTTGSIAGNWQPTAKMVFNLQYARDTGIETRVSTSDVNRVYTTWRFTGNYALTGKVVLNAGASLNRSRRGLDSANSSDFEENKGYNLGARWAFTRSLSLSCQYDHSSRNSSTALYVYSADSYGCTGQVMIY